MVSARVIFVGFSLVFYILGAFLIKQLFHALVGYEMIIANSAPRLLVIYALVGYLQSHIQRAFVE